MERLNKKEVNKVVQLLKEEKVVALPTDTVYGFSCLPTSDRAVKKLCELKHCDDEKLFIVLVSKNYNLDNLIECNGSVLDFIKSNTPNPLTMIVNKKSGLKLSKNFHLPTLAIRVPNDAFLQSVLNEVGFMISTSCNIHGEPNINSVNEIIDKFDDLDAIVIDNPNQNAKPSTIVDLTSSEIKIIRQGDYVLR